MAHHLAKCFDQAGDLVVTVRPIYEEGTLPEHVGPPVKKFKVWSPLLEQWSDVFAAMFRSEFKENSRSELEIQDFSAEAVEAFLRFMYSGMVVLRNEVLVEVKALADKYDIPQLRSMCALQIQKAITNENLFAFLSLAHRHGCSTTKNKCLDKILYEPETSLKNASKLPRCLLDEILTSPLLAVTDDQLVNIFIGWAQYKSMSSAEVVTLVKSHIGPQSYSEDVLISVLEGRVEAAALKHCGDTAGSPTEDLFATLKALYEAKYPSPVHLSSRRPPFLGYWVNMIPNTPDFGNTEVRPGDNNNFLPVGFMMEQAANQRQIVLSPGQEIIWWLPHHRISPTGIRFENNIGSSHILVAVSTDGQCWVDIYNSSRQKDAGTILVPCRLKGMVVSWIRLRVLRGSYENKLRIHGFMQ